MNGLLRISYKFSRGHNSKIFVCSRLKFDSINPGYIFFKNTYLLISVFTQPCLEKDPNYNVPPQEIFRVPKPGTVDWNQSSEDHRSIFDATMDRLRQRTNQRRVLTKPVFQDFDKYVLFICIFLYFILHLF